MPAHKKGVLGAPGDPVEAKTCRPWSEFRDEGLLWLINSVVLHPRGFALALHYDDEAGTGEPVGWSIVGPGDEPYVFGNPMWDEQARAAFSEEINERFRRVEAVFEQARGTWPSGYGPEDD